MARWSSPVDKNEDPRQCENKQCTDSVLSCRTSLSGYSLMSLQLLRVAQSTRGFGKNAQTGLIGFLVVE